MNGVEEKFPGSEEEERIFTLDTKMELELLCKPVFNMKNRPKSRDTILQETKKIVLTCYGITMIKSHLVIKIIKWYAIETVHDHQNSCWTNGKDKQDLFEI